MVSYSLSTNYSAGSYIFSGNAWSAAMFHGLQVQAGRFNFSASLPIVAQNNTALTYIGGVIVPTGGPDGAAVAERARRGNPCRWGRGGEAGRACSVRRAGLRWPSPPVIRSPSPSRAAPP